MRGVRDRSALVWVVFSILSMGLFVSCGGGDGDGGGPGVLKEIRVSPPIVMLRDTNTTVSLAVTGITTTGRRIDLKFSPDTAYSTSNPPVATVTPVGVVAPQGEGTATITVVHLSFSALVPLYSDYTPALSAGDFDLAVPDEAPSPGERVTVPLLLETGSREFGSYQALITYDPNQLKLIKVAPGSDLGAPLAKRSDTPGEVEVLDTYRPSLGQSLTGTIEAARLVFKVVGDSGQASILTGKAIDASDDAFPAAPLGAATPRDFVTGKRWLAIE